MQEGQILTALGNLDELQGLPSYSFKGTNITEDLGDLHLWWDEEADITMIPEPSKTTNEGPADKSYVQTQKITKTAPIKKLIQS